MSLFSSNKSYWASQAAQIRRKRDELHEQQKQYLLPLYSKLDEKLITTVLSSTASELIEQVQLGNYRSSDIVLIYSYRACRCGELLNSNTEELFVDAHKYAVQQDQLRADERKSTNTPLGEKLSKYSRLLEGLPISVKDQYQQSGCTSSCGVVSLATEDKRYTTDGILIQLIREQGGIPFVRSNVPQLLMFCETDNAIYGEGKNPYNELRTCGGSSGGEAALLSSNASPLGIGSDIGGSLRIPAHSSGIIGYKCTPERGSIVGLNIARHQPVDGMQYIKNCTGPMGRSVDDCILILKTWWCDKLYKADPWCAPLPFNDSVYHSTNKLRIGYYIDDGYCKTSKPVARAINETVDILRSHGHTLIEFQPLYSKQLMLAYSSLFLGDGGDDFFGALLGESPNQRYTLQVVIKSLPTFIKPLIRQLLRLAGQHRLAELAGAAERHTVNGYWKVQSSTTQYVQKYLQRINELELDAWICPVTCFPATIQKTSGDVIPGISTLQQNLLKVPGGSIPVTVVQKGETDYTDQYNDMITKKIQEICSNSEGLPIGVQVCSLPYHDETVLRVMKEIESKVQFNKKYPPMILNRLK